MHSEDRAGEETELCLRKDSSVSFSSVLPHNAFFVDASLSTWLTFFKGLFLPVDISRVENEIVSLWDPVGLRAMVTLSVRSGLDLFLQAQKIPFGGEVLMGAINIPDVPRILRSHGLVPVPVDLSFDTLQPRVEDLEAALTPRTRVLLLAHLYGSRGDISEAVAFARKHNLIVIEDCAETAMGDFYRGHPEADASFFSFGLIKTATAFGGAVARVGNSEVLRKMRALQSGYPVYPRKRYLQRLLAGLFVIWGQSRLATGALLNFNRLIGTDHKELVVRLVRGFPGASSSPEAFLSKYRFRPCGPLLASLRARLGGWVKKEQPLREEGEERLYRLAVRLDEEGIRVPALRATRRHFWLFPIVVPSSLSPASSNPAECQKGKTKQSRGEKGTEETPLSLTDAQKLLGRVGVDAYRGATQLGLVEPPATGAFIRPEQAAAFMDRALYIPLHPHMSSKEMLSCARRVVAALQQTEHQEESKLRKPGNGTLRKKEAPSSNQTPSAEALTEPEENKATENRKEASLRGSRPFSSLAMSLAVGSPVPSASVSIGGEKVNFADVLKGKKAIVFAVPGAFTPTCSEKHLPGYLAYSDEFASLGVKDIYCTSTNDPFVLKAWAADRKVPDGKITMVADGNGDFAKAAGKVLDLTEKLMGVRTNRYAFIVDDGKVVWVADGEDSFAEKALEFLKK
uniref:Thioredoxin domain-containing protein n=1 Tax=Chromera velia CCMP2878 TaxID=1169474 RepID=A0A0G4FCJ8_9ALVE|eukprot:Cvel_16350.t1-p1 / transcript=Cvel_16350.t1 / gene=Cvel_16350 / organism=Chromera_velia_CCMP2878 / gene_product=Peroxiredoxin-2E-2, chloroplastic, putative / transcript_product=Peroxiredoxin-2E-2, chloroplastic, putative / location=Cvel_scaffold1255:23520-30365(+) / protein_length=683 / sequence_SO=supercontig / SO=protein_coding / is_pseudo=false